MDPCISKARSLPFSSFEDATESGIGKQIPPRSMELNQTASGKLTDREPHPEILGISNAYDFDISNRRKFSVSFRSNFSVTFARR
jgi:hypothetical protein